MTLEHVLDEALGDSRVVRDSAAVFQDDEIHHAECRHQFRPGTLRHQGMGRVGYLHYQTPTGRGAFTEPPDVFREQRIKLAGDPLGRMTVQPLAGVLLGYDFGPRVQES